MKDGPFPTPTTELRQSTRNAVSWRARVLMDGNSFIDCRTFDISLGGVGLLCSKPLSKETVFLVALQVPPTGTADTRVVTGQAKAVFQILSGNDYRIGMQWTQPNDPALAPLNSWSTRRPGG